MEKPFSETGEVAPKDSLKGPPLLGLIRSEKIRSQVCRHFIANKCAKI